MADGRASPPFDLLPSQIHVQEGDVIAGRFELVRPLGSGGHSVVWRARDAIEEAIGRRGIEVVLGMGGYVTIPAALATRRARVSLFVAEQNAGAGLANRVAARWAAQVFTSFPHTHGLERGEWVGRRWGITRAVADLDGANLPSDLPLDAGGVDGGGGRWRISFKPLTDRLAAAITSPLDRAFDAGVPYLVNVITDVNATYPRNTFGI